jgi:hypothetical protein
MSSDSHPGREAVEWPSWVAKLLGGFGLVVAVAWGFAEGTLFFVVPDLAPTLAALFCWRAAVRLTSGVLLGSICAGALMFAWASHDQDSARAAVRHVPFVREAMVERVRTDYAEAGARGLLRGPFSGIPYKLYAVEAPGRAGPGEFLLWSVPARLQRFALGVLVAAIIGVLVRRPIRRRPWIAAAAWGAYWTTLYAWYWTMI